MIKTIQILKKILFFIEQSIPRYLYKYILKIIYNVHRTLQQRVFTRRK